MSGSRGLPQLGIVVVSYGSADLLAANLARIDRAALPPSTVVVVENHTDPRRVGATREVAAAHGWELVEPGTNLGFGAGMNLGVGRALRAGSEHVLLLNPDVAVDASAVAALLDASRARPLSLLTGRLSRPDGIPTPAAGEIDHRTGLTRTRPEQLTGTGDPWLSGACLLTSRRCWEAAGGFDERYFLYWEDLDLSRRVLDAGGELQVVEAATGHHAVGGTQRAAGPGAQGRGDPPVEGPVKTPAYCYYNCRNRLLYAAAHVATRDRLRWLVHAPRYAALVTLRHGRAVALRHPSLGLAALAGTAVGAIAVVASVLPRRGRR